MNTLLNATLSASGSPSDVKARIDDQVKAAATNAPDQSSFLAAARGYIEKAITGVSEDTTLAVTAAFTVTVLDAPLTVTQKTDALKEQIASLTRQLAGATDSHQTTKAALATVTSELAAANAALTAAPVAGDSSTVGV